MEGFAAPCLLRGYSLTFALMKERTGSQEAQSSGAGVFPHLRKRLHRRLGVGQLDWLAGRQLDDALAEELEDQLLLADVGVDATRRIIDGLRRRSTKDNGPASESMRELLSYKSDVDLNNKLAEWEQFYNFARPHGAHQGRTPYESLREKLT